MRGWVYESMGVWDNEGMSIKANLRKIPSTTKSPFSACTINKKKKEKEENKEEKRRMEKKGVITLRKGANFFAFLKGLNHFIILQHKDTFISHKHFVTIYSFFFRENFHFFCDLIGPPSNCHMKTVIAIHLFICPLSPFIVSNQQRFSFARNYKINQHCGSSCNLNQKAIYFLLIKKLIEFIQLLGSQYRNHQLRQYPWMVIACECVDQFPLFKIEIKYYRDYSKS